MFPPIISKQKQQQAMWTQHTLRIRLIWEVMSISRLSDQSEILVRQ